MLRLGKVVSQLLDAVRLTKRAVNLATGASVVFGKNFDNQ